MGLLIGEKTKVDYYFSHSPYDLGEMEATERRSLLRVMTSKKFPILSVLVELFYHNYQHYMLLNSNLFKIDWWLSEAADPENDFKIEMSEFYDLEQYCQNIIDLENSLITTSIMLGIPWIKMVQNARKSAENIYYSPANECCLLIQAIDICVTNIIGSLDLLHWDTRSLSPINKMMYDALNTYHERFIHMDDKLLNLSFRISRYNQLVPYAHKAQAARDSIFSDISHRNKKLVVEFSNKIYYHTFIKTVLTDMDSENPTVSDLCNQPIMNKIVNSKRVIDLLLRNEKTLSRTYDEFIATT